MAGARQYNNFSTLLTDPLRNFKFLVNISHNPSGSPTGNIARLGFTSVSGLTMTTESIPYRQGGYNTTVHQIPGQTTFSPVTLQRGVTIGSRQNWDWMRQLFTTVLGSGLFPASGGIKGNRNFRVRADIEVLDHPVTADYNPANDINTAAEANSTNGFSGGTGFLEIPVKMRFRLYNAWISGLSYSDLNAGDNSLLVEQMTLVHEGFDVKWASTSNMSDAPDFAV